MATEQRSIRLSQDTVDRLKDLQNGSQSTDAEMVETLVEEAHRMNEHPGVVFRSGPAGRRAGLAAGPDVWEIVSALHQLEHTFSDPISELAEQIRLDPHWVQVAWKYYQAFPFEIDEWIALNDATFDEFVRNTSHGEHVTSR